MLIIYHERECEVTGLNSLLVSGWPNHFQCISGKKKKSHPIYKMNRLDKNSVLFSIVATCHVSFFFFFN